VVLKPSPLTPLEALILGEIAQEIDLPPGVLNVVTGGPDVGEMLTTDPRVDMVSFTGSDVIGAAVMAQASRTLKRVLLELGGKSALIVRDDADFDAAVTAGAAQAVTLSGQGCANWTRHIVHRSLKEEYVRRLVDVVTAAKLGDPGKDSTVTMGPLISATQRGRVEDYVDSGRRNGAVVMCGGRRPTNLAKGFFYEPTVLDEVDNRWKVAQEEIFGPVVVVLGFDEDDEAIAIANDSQYGLSGAIFSADSGTAYEMALRLRTGGVSINGGAGAITGAAPFGGYRRSGIGRERGDEGMWAYTELKTIGFNAG
jgi:aldehyde dehydrogenase (NAD+)